MFNLTSSRQYQIWNSLAGGLRFWLIHIYFFSIVPTMPRLPYRRQQVIAKDICFAKIFPKKHKWYHFYRYSPNIIRHLIDPLVSIWLLLFKPFTPYYVDRLKLYRKPIAIVCYLPIFIISLATHVGAKAILYWLLFPLSCPYYFYRNWDRFTSKQKRCAILLYLLIMLAIATFFVAPYIHLLAGTFIAAYSLATTSWFSATASALFTTMALWKSALIVTITSLSLSGLIVSGLANIFYRDVKPQHPQLKNRETSYRSDLSFLLRPSDMNIGQNNSCKPSKSNGKNSDNGSTATQLNNKISKISNLLTPPTTSEYPNYRYHDGNTLNELIRKSVGEDKLFDDNDGNIVEKTFSHNEENSHDDYHDSVKNSDNDLSGDDNIQHTLSHSIDSLLNLNDNDNLSCHSEEIIYEQNTKTIE